MPDSPEVLFQIDLQRSLLQICNKSGHSGLEEQMYQELIRREAVRPTPPRIYEFFGDPGYLVVDRPFSFTGTQFVWRKPASEKTLQLHLSREERDGGCTVHCRITQDGRARSRLPIVATCIGTKEYFEKETNPQGRCDLLLPLGTDSDSLIVVAAMARQKAKSAPVQGVSARAHVELNPSTAAR